MTDIVMKNELISYLIFPKFYFSHFVPSEPTVAHSLSEVEGKHFLLWVLVCISLKSGWTSWRVPCAHPGWWQLSQCRPRGERRELLGAENPHVYSAHIPTDLGSMPPLTWALGKTGKTEARSLSWLVGSWGRIWIQAIFLQN